jgi:ArsR family transcriptional regulator, arsenate/arsenite/antimonite-responsive transcriptional repressor
LTEVEVVSYNYIYSYTHISIYNFSKEVRMTNLNTFFKVMSDETRLRIIALLAEEDLCVCEICGILELSQPKVSKHLSKLRDLGYVLDKRKEKFIFYSLTFEDDTMQKMIALIVSKKNEYPQLKMDAERLQYKNDYLNICKTNLL